MIQYLSALNDTRGVLMENRLITEEMLKKLGKSDKYYNKNRIVHYNEIIVQLEKIFKESKVEKVLEIGPYTAPFVINCDIMDIKRYKYPFKINKFIEHDCSEVPFPIEDKEYDLVIASQVLEHLGIYGEQVKVFDEIERISDKALITLPYDWNAPHFRHHHRIDEYVFDYWASNREYEFQEISGTDPDFRRILRIYDFK